jgi:heat shock protein HslJ
MSKIGATTMSLSFRPAGQIHAVFAVVLLCFASAPVFATADGPDFYRVVDVTSNNVLNMRASPNTNGTVIGAIPSDADGIANFGCIGGLTLTEYEAATATERAAARKTRWCKVGYDRIIGWAAGWFLAEGGSEDSFRRGALLGSLAGSEWQVRDFAGNPVDVETWIAFKADGTVVGNGGCNQFNGGYTENGRSLQFGPIAATRKACPDPKMSVEMDLFNAFDATREVVATHLVLALFDETGTLLATLTRRDWD